MRTGLAVRFAFLAVAGLCSCGGIAGAQAAPGDAVPIAAPLEAKEFKATAKDLTRIEDMVRATLNDADSAKFRKVTFYRNADGSWFACGSVNSKGRFGGYEGWEPFWAKPLEGALVLDNADYGPVSAFKEMFPRCALAFLD